MYTEEINTVFIILFGIVLLIVFAVIFLFMTFNYRKNKLLQENLETKLSNQKRQHELELKALRGQMNPHFVHNSLNAIQYYIQKNDVETSENYLAKFSKLMRQFFDFSRRKTISLSEEINLLQNYLEIEKLRFEDKLDYNIQVDKKIDTDDQHIPSMLLQPLVENAINHGLFHKKGKGKLTVAFDFITDHSFKITIEDNGIGINKAKSMNATIKKNNGSHSSAVLKERIHFLNKGTRYNVQFDINDCTNDNTNDIGTRVTLKIHQDYDQNYNHTHRR